MRSPVFTGIRPIAVNSFVASLGLAAARRAGAIALRASPLVLLVASGCSQNAFTLKGQVDKLQTEQTQLAQRNQELQNRANTLDKANQELETALAQTKQQSQRLEEHLALLREQLGSASTQLAQLMGEKQTTEQRAQAMMASAKRRSDASITPNNSLLANLPAVNIPGIEVRQDGDVVRIELPADRLFEPGTARLTSSAGMLIDAVAGEVARAYPSQMIGIEGHTDSDTLLGTGAASSHQLSASRAAAVHEYLTTRDRLRPQQLFIAGHGSNHPVVSNASLTGKARNRRVELVIYPEAGK